MVLTLEGIRVSAGGTTAPPGADADGILVVGRQSVQIQVQFGVPERESVTTVRLGSLRHPRLRLRAPLDLAVTWHDPGVSVFDPQTGLWGEGEHLTLAIEDFQATLAELYSELRDSSDRLGPAMQDEWQALQQWVQERP
jgi:hypothetical protein